VTGLSRNCRESFRLDEAARCWFGKCNAGTKATNAQGALRLMLLGERQGYQCCLLICGQLGGNS
jgi:hypothetical protein